MKRRIMTILIALTIFLPFKIFAATSDSYIDWTLDRTIFAHQYRNGEDHITNLAWITANGETAYCIEPGITADKGSYYSSTTNINDTNLRGIDTKRLSLIGYYGYGYKNHTSKEYYMATQELIWRFMGVDNVWWTDQKEGGNTYNLGGEKKNILSLVNAHETAPSFSFESEYLIGDNITLNDNNNVLEDYEVKKGNVSISGNTISFNVKDNNTFTLKRKNNGKSPVYFYKNGYQTIGSFKGTYDYEQNYDVKGVYGKITIEKLDSDTKTNQSISDIASLKDAEYGLYDENNNLIMASKTDESGKAIFDSLNKGRYKIKEIISSNGYTLDDKVYEALLDTNNKIQNVKSYEKIIKNKIILFKVLDDYDDMCIPEEGILFSVYDLNNNLITKEFTDNNGNITFELNYGNYIIKQETNIPGVTMVDDFRVDVLEDGVTQNFVLINHKLKRVSNKVITSYDKKTLPNTGKSMILIPIILLLNMIGIIREKKFS